MMSIALCQRPASSDKQKAAVEEAARGVLDARSLYPECSLAELYAPCATPPELVKAHDRLDCAVEKACGERWESENECVAYLMRRYREFVTREERS